MVRMKLWLFGSLALVGTMAAGCSGDCKAVIHPTSGGTVDTVTLALTGQACIAKVYGAVDSVGPQPKQ